MTPMSKPLQFQGEKCTLSIVIALLPGSFKLLNSLLNTDILKGKTACSVNICRDYAV